MADRDTYRSDTSFGRVLEVHVLDAKDLEFRETIEVPQGADVLVFAISDPGGNPLPRLDGIRIDFRPTGGTFPSRRPDYQEHREMRQDTLLYAVILNPPPGEWEVIVNARDAAPFVVHVAGLETRLVRAAGQPPTPLKVRFKCKACKAVSKGLALAIVATAATAAIPAALTAAVAAFLGVAAAGAVAFVGSVVGDAADEVSAKLCKAVRLC